MLEAIKKLFGVCTHDYVVVHTEKLVLHTNEFNWWEGTYEKQVAREWTEITHRCRKCHDKYTETIEGHLSDEDIELIKLGQ